MDFGTRVRKPVLIDFSQQHRAFDLLGLGRLRSFSFGDLKQRPADADGPPDRDLQHCVHASNGEPAGRVAPRTFYGKVKLVWIVAPATKVKGPALLDAPPAVAFKANRPAAAVFATKIKVAGNGAYGATTGGATLST
jgi:hypothetical protein